MKIAVLHNYMDYIGGAERVSLTLAKYLKADLISTNINTDSIKKMGFSGITTQSIGRVPINAPFRQQVSLLRFRYLNLTKDYDFFIISGDWAVSAAFNNKPNLWYVHSPIREIWDLYRYTRVNISIFKRPFFDCWVFLNRHLNRRYINHVDKIVCNSQTTQARIKKFFGRDSVVINPPIKTALFHYKKNGNYWLSVNRLINHKRVDIQMNAFRKLPNENLVVVGCYEKSAHFQGYANYIKRIKPPNVTLLESVTFSELIKLYANCKGFITTSKEEDFGMTAVEAMASGKSVIAPAEGGYRETVINNITGILIKEINSEKLADAVRIVGKNPRSYKRACLKQAKKFDTRIFIKKIKEQVNL